MADTKRQIIMDSLLTTLGNITIDNGYVTNAGKTVFDYKETPIEVSDMPCLNVRDVSDEVDPTELYMWDRSLEVTITGYALGLVRDARKIAGDVYKVLSIDPNFNKCVYDVNVVGDTMSVEHNENIIAEVTITINLLYRTGAYDPYTTIND